MDNVIEADSQGIDQAIRMAGSQAKLADALGVTQQAVFKWQKQGYVPVERIAQIADKYGIERTRLIDPDLKRIMQEW